MGAFFEFMGFAAFAAVIRFLLVINLTHNEVVVYFSFSF
jgi:hypothetical protein